LHLGSGYKRWPGWINIDGFAGAGIADITADLHALPFASGIAVRAAAIHVLEHLWRWEAATIVREWIRTLQPGGQLILELPCMDKVFKYIRELPDGDLVPVNLQMTGWAIWGDPKYKDPSMMHRWGYFKMELRQLLETVGLVHIQDETPHYHRVDRDMRMVGYKPG
jgi:SAM-dependent methyltransferase